MKSFLKFFLLYIFLLFFTFRDLLLNIKTNLVDWFDYPLMLWIMHHSISKISSLQFTEFFNTSSFYPYTNTLFFSDLLLPQAVLAWPLYIITRNLILAFNLVFILTFILNYIGAYLFWKRIFKSDLLAFTGSLFLLFSPFLHLNISHFQMLSIWPSLFCLYFILDKDFKPKRIVIAGVFLTLQFLASVYLSVYLIVTIAVLYFFKFLQFRKAREIFLSFGIILLSFLLICGVFIKGYSDTKKLYNINREVTEYIQYSAHLSDYIFTGNINSTLHQSQIMKKWNDFNKHFIGVHSSSPGFLLLILSVLGLFSFIKEKRDWVLQLAIDHERFFFLTLAFLGFIFSLGPRLSFNGTYAHIPLPYFLFLHLPLFEITRVPARWSFILFLAMVYFAVLGVRKLWKKINPKFLIPLIFIIFILEYVPLNFTTHSENYLDPSYIPLKTLCLKEKLVLLEIPITHLDAAPNIAAGLNYITKTQLASTYHNCLMVNGYSGYDMPEIAKLRDRIYLTIKNADPDAFLSILDESNIDIVKFNTSLLLEELREPSSELFAKLLENPRIQLLENTTFFIKKPVNSFH